MTAYAPLLLQRKARRIIKQMDAEKGAAQRKVQTVYEREKGEESWREFMVRSLVRPFVLFAQEPIIQLFGVYLAFVYGVIYREFRGSPAPRCDVWCGVLTRDALLKWY